MTLGVVSSKLFYREGGRYVTTGGFGRQMEALAQRFDRVVLAVPVAEGSPEGAYEISSGNVDYCPLPPYRTQPQLLARLPILAWRILRHVREWDLVHARLPDLTGWMGFAAARVRARPVFVTLTSDWEESILVRGETGARGVARWALNLYVRFYLGLERYAARRALAFAVGRGLYERYRWDSGKVELTISTTVRRGEIAPPRRTCDNGSVQLLFVGRLTRAKGLTYLLDAVRLLLDRGRDVRLSIVGGGELRDSLETAVATRGLGDVVTFHGAKTLGPELSAHYRAADIFVLPSVSEALGKVILEAMASALPVVATDVGGVATIVEDGATGLLVEPKSAEALADAVERLVDDGELRTRVIQRGLVVAGANTIEEETEELLSRVEAEFPHLFPRHRTERGEPAHHAGARPPSGRTPLRRAPASSGAAADSG